MKFAEALIAWTPPTPEDEAYVKQYATTLGQVKIGPLLTEGHSDWTRAYACTGGAAFVDVRELTGAAALARCLLDWHHMVVGDGIDTTVAHEAFLAIDEYREALSPDIPGATSERSGGDFRGRVEEFGRDGDDDV